jgi:deazaflavin-dependent oxidoreductase (nitroreductase family)
MITPRFEWATRFLLHLPTHIYDWHAGWLLDRRFLRLTHHGRKSGRQYQTLLEVVDTNPVTDEVIVMSGFGHAADWLQNLQAAPVVEVAIGRRRFFHNTGSSTRPKPGPSSPTTSDGTGSSPRSSGESSHGWSDGRTTAATLPGRDSSDNCRWSASGH